MRRDAQVARRHGEGDPLAAVRRYNNFVKAQGLAAAGPAFGGVLDLGCGRGGDLPKYGHLPGLRRLCGLDVSPVSVREAQARAASIFGARPEVAVQLFAADLRDEAQLRAAAAIAGHQAPFEVVTMFFSLQYVAASGAHVERLLRLLVNPLTAEGARLVLSVPGAPQVERLAAEGGAGLASVDRLAPATADGWGRGYGFQLLGAIDDFTPEYLLPPDSLAAAFAAGGWRVLSRRPFDAEELQSGGGPGLARRMRVTTLPAAMAPAEREAVGLNDLWVLERRPGGGTVCTSP